MNGNPPIGGMGITTLPPAIYLLPLVAELPAGFPLSVERIEQPAEMLSRMAELSKGIDNPIVLAMPTAVLRVLLATEEAGSFEWPLRRVVGLDGALDSSWSQRAAMLKAISVDELMETRATLEGVQTLGQTRHNRERPPKEFEKSLATAASTAAWGALDGQEESEL